METKSLIETINLMELFEEAGYVCYFKGKGDGTVIPVVETVCIINENKNKK